MTGPVLADSEQEARAALAVLESCPALDRAKLALPYVPVELADLYAGAHAAYPDGHRYSADNMWTHAPIEELLPGLRRIAETMPPAPSHMLWMNWGPGTTPEPEASRHGLQRRGRHLHRAVRRLAGPRRRRANVDWATERMREMEPQASGIQLADENLGNRPARFLSDEHSRGLDELRAKYDPDGRFHSWMGRPPQRRSMSRSPLSDYLGAPMAVRPTQDVLGGDRARPDRPSDDALALSDVDRLLDPGAAGARDRLVRAGRRRRLCRCAHRDARRERRDGGLVVRLASARFVALPRRGTRHRAPWATRCKTLGGRARAKRPTGARCIIRSRTWAPAWFTPASSSRRPPRWACRATRSTTRVATIVCGYAGDDRLHVRHTPMFHVFLREGDGQDGSDRGRPGNTDTAPWPRRLGRDVAQPLLARCRAPTRRPAGWPRGRAQQPFVRRRALPEAPRGHSRATAPRSTPTSARCCRSSTRASVLGLPPHSERDRFAGDSAVRRGLRSSRPVTDAMTAYSHDYAEDANSSTVLALDSFGYVGGDGAECGLHADYDSGRYAVLPSSVADSGD